MELDAAQTFRALGKAKRLGVRGGLVHDLLHAEAALLAGAKKILTLNTEDFRAIRQGTKVLLAYHFRWQPVVLEVLDL